jgi:hypothetical protein
MTRRFIELQILSSVLWFCRNSPLYLAAGLHDLDPSFLLSIYAFFLELFLRMEEVLIQETELQGSISTEVPIEEPAIIPIESTPNANEIISTDHSEKNNSYQAFSEMKEPLYEDKADSKPVSTKGQISKTQWEKDEKVS